MQRLIRLACGNLQVPQLYKSYNQKYSHEHRHTTAFQICIRSDTPIGSHTSDRSARNAQSNPGKAGKTAPQKAASESAPVGKAFVKRIAVKKVTVKAIPPPKDRSHRAALQSGRRCEA